MSALGKRLGAAAIVGTAAAAVAVVLWAVGAFNGVEQKSWDWREQLLAHPDAASGRIALILLDQQSLDWGKKENQLSWPWPRQVYAPLIAFAMRGGARSIGFDVLFTEPSVYGVSDDQAFGAAIADSGRFVGSIFLSKNPHEGDAATWPHGIPEPRLHLAGLDQLRASGGALPAALTFASASPPIPDVTAHARYLANVQALPDSDGVYRRIALFSIFDGRAIPSLALATYLAGTRGHHRLALEGPLLAHNPGSFQRLLDRLLGRNGELLVDGKRVPLEPDGSTYLRYGPAGGVADYSAAAVIQSELQIESGDKPNIDPSVFKDKYVLFGFSAPGLYDLRPSPVSGVFPGVKIHATALDNLLTGDFIRSASPLASVLLALLVALVAAVAASFVSGVVRNVIVYVVMIVVAPAASLLAYAGGLRLPLVLPEVAGLLSLVGTSILNYATEGRQKRYIKGAFKQYLSPAVIEELIAHPERLRLGGERRDLSIFFSDLQGFTGLSEALTPEQLTSLLNEYLSAMTDIIHEEGGTIDKYEGDAIIAFWNAPIAQEDHPVRAVRAALRCQSELSRLRPAFRERVGKDLFVRIGINTGAAVVGNMGSRSRFDYTMLGDAVNLASRLEGVNKQFRTFTMISQMTFERVNGAYAGRELSRIAVVGRKEPVTVYEPMTHDEFTQRAPLFATFTEGLHCFYEGEFLRAAERFSVTAEKDPAAAAYEAKCRELAAFPPKEWRGVWVMTEK